MTASIDFKTNRYAQRFATLQKTAQGAFIPFTLLGWPSMDVSFDIIQTMIASGVTALELGFPFSDPVADGPVIQAAGVEALEAGFTVAQGFELLKRVRQLNDEIPIGLLVYYNLVLAQGLDGFFRQAADAGVDGVLMADLPPEAADEVAPIAARYGIVLIFIVSPLTTEVRLQTISQIAGGFFYVVSRLGITGVEERTDHDLAGLLKRVKQHSSLPALVGFGISSPEQAQQMMTYGADGVITGSRIIQLLQATPITQWQTVLGDFLTCMRHAVQVAS